MLAGFAHHPNVAAYVIVGLGCEVSFAQHLVDSQDLIVTIGGARADGKGKPDRPRVLNIQEQGGISKTVEAAVEAVHRLLPEANSLEADRAAGVEDPAGDGVRRVGRQLGGHRQPGRLGVAADLLIARGGATVLGETTEIYGAEHLLTKSGRLARRRREAGRADSSWWEWYAEGSSGARSTTIPSPGNKEGGLTTIYEKSLGALAKAGSTARWSTWSNSPRRVDKPGLHFMDTPGYDPICTTGLVASGANVLVFTTGRGSVLGLKPTPCIKVATNTPMFERMIRRHGHERRDDPRRRERRRARGGACSR